MGDAFLVSFTEMVGCRPGEALAVRWREIEGRVAITRGLSGKQIADQTKTDRDRQPAMPVHRRDWHPPSPVLEQSLHRAT